jgi:hypothetical protein
LRVFYSTARELILFPVSIMCIVWSLCCSIIYTYVAYLSHKISGLFLRVLRFPLPIFILPIAPQPPSSITSRLLATDLNTETITSDHYEVFLSSRNFPWLSSTKNSELNCSAVNF